MNVCKWCMSGSSTENNILLSVQRRLSKNFNQSINHSERDDMSEPSESYKQVKIDNQNHSLGVETSR